MLLTNNYRIHLRTVRDDEPLAKSTGALDLLTKLRTVSADNVTICFALTVIIDSYGVFHMTYISMFPKRGMN